MVNMDIAYAHYTRDVEMTVNPAKDCPCGFPEGRRLLRQQEKALLPHFHPPSVGIPSCVSIKIHEKSRNPLIFFPIIIIV